MLCEMIYNVDLKELPLCHTPLQLRLILSNHSGDSDPHWAAPSFIWNSVCLAGDEWYLEDTTSATYKMRSMKCGPLGCYLQHAA